MPLDEMTGSKIQLVWSGMPKTAHNRGGTQRLQE